ncbi:hypothetical protein FDP41_004048 [Naegleria fowleri]|uniref:Zn(2)-C6 fungal-type domain-containing protein n=1 Tax=Naegleria fowleri TaxID=5763 RepID=A0A6A5BFY3_NAEFO|nr:uncharacterized protein FDP41_004048 [Naegleria fowleri]KAF0976753.1 hypothetical protein FDP41_004048 [Naegleria fowleri]CAG4712115.1 unnamed protein product [Naegleria fowleri]
MWQHQQAEQEAQRRYQSNNINERLQELPPLPPHHDHQRVTLHRRESGFYPQRHQQQQLTDSTLYQSSNNTALHYPTLPTTATTSSIRHSTNPISPPSSSSEHHHNYSMPIRTTYPQQAFQDSHPPILPPISTLTSSPPHDHHYQQQHVSTMNNPFSYPSQDVSATMSSSSSYNSFSRKSFPPHQDLLATQHGVSTSNQFYTTREMVTTRNEGHRADSMCVPSSSSYQHLSFASQQQHTVVYNHQNHPCYDSSTHALGQDRISITPPSSTTSASHPATTTSTSTSTTDLIVNNTNSHNMGPTCGTDSSFQTPSFLENNTCVHASSTTHAPSTCRTHQKSKRKSRSAPSSESQTNWTFHAHARSDTTDASFVLNPDSNFTAPVVKPHERISVACSECRKAKKRCSGGRPCDRCASMGKQCKDEHSGKKRGRKKKESSESVQEKNSTSDDGNRKHVKTSDSSIGTESLSSETTSSKNDVASPFNSSNLSNLDNEKEEERKTFQEETPNFNKHLEE